MNSVNSLMSSSVSSPQMVFGMFAQGWLSGTGSKAATEAPSVLGEREAVGDADLVQVGVRREREQAGVLVLPAEAPEACRPVGFEHGDGDELPSDLVAALAGLRGGEVLERGVRDGLDEAVAERVERGAEAEDGLGAGAALLYARVDGAVVQERAAGAVDEVAEGVEVAGAELCDLADGAGHGVLVALGAGLRVVDGPEAVGDDVHLLEGGLDGVELGLLLRGRPVEEAGDGLVVEGRGRLRGGLALHARARGGGERQRHDGGRHEGQFQGSHIGLSSGDPGELGIPRGKEGRSGARARECAPAQLLSVALG
jgi:hypothetical protein